MARIRSVKPDLFLNEQVGELSMAARVMFIGLFTQADKHGRLEWAPKRLKVQLFPYDADVDMDVLADELVEAALARVYQLDGDWYLDLPRFTRHQRPHPKEPESTIPECPADWKSHGKPWKKTASRVLPGSIPASPARKGREGDLGREGSGSNGAPVSVLVHTTAAKPKPYDHALIPKRDLSALYEGRYVNIPAGRWAEGHRKAYRLTDDDLEAFGKWLNERIERDGGIVEDGGKRFPWLDSKLAEYRAAKFRPNDGLRPAQEWVDEYAKTVAEVAEATAKAKADGTYRTFAEIRAEIGAARRGTA